MSEINDSRYHKINWIENVAANIIKCGNIPKHVAFIMDGNRRYANKVNLDRVAGHKQGFDTLAKVLSWCRHLGITQVTLYAFSVENFKRTQDEVESIMNLARQKCDSILGELDKVNEAGIRIKVAGDIHLLPKDLAERVETIQNMTCNNTRAYLNVCLAYTSRHELVAAIKDLSTMIHCDKSLDPDEVDLARLEQKLYIRRPFPELIIRTSGEVRLSDFMLWQSQESILIFVKALWPEISFWDFLKAIFHYQCQSKYQTCS